MTEISKEILIEASVEKIYNYVSEPKNIPQFWPGVLEIKNVKLLTNGGYSYLWTYKAAGIRFTGKGEGVDVTPNLRLISKNIGIIESLIAFTFRSIDHQTKVTLTVNYLIQLPVIGQLSQNTFVKIYEPTVEMVLNNLKTKFETKPEDLK